MIRMKYHELLDPDLYRDKPFVANFVESLHSPEIDQLSNIEVVRLLQSFMPTDDISSIMDPLLSSATQKILTTGSLPPEFSIYPQKNKRIKLELGPKVPTTSSKIQRFLSAGKALGLIRAGQCIFFSVMQPIRDEAPVFGEDVSDISTWGILIVGSSLRGNCFSSLNKMVPGKQIRFKPIHRKIMREEKHDNYPFSDFFNIMDDDEMGRIIAQIPRLMSSNNLEEKKCLVNFSTTLKALENFKV